MKLRTDTRYRLATGQVVGPLIDLDGTGEVWGYETPTHRGMPIPENPDLELIPMWTSDGNVDFYGIPEFDDPLNEHLRIVAEVE